MHFKLPSIGQELEIFLLLLEANPNRIMFIPYEHTILNYPLKTDRSSSRKIMKKKMILNYIIEVFKSILELILSLRIFNSNLLNLYLLKTAILNLFAHRGIWQSSSRVMNLWRVMKIAIRKIVRKHNS